RTRLLNTLSGKAVDRIPVSPFIWSNFVNEYFKRQLADQELDEACFKVYKDLGFDTMLRTCNIAEATDECFLDSRNWQVELLKKQISEKERHEITIIKTPERTLTQVKSFQRITPYEEVNANIECFIKSKEDFHQFIKYQPQVPTYDCSRITRSKQMLGNEGITAPWTQGIFNYLGDLRKPENLVLDMIMDPLFYHQMMTYFTDRWVNISAQFAKAGADVLCVSGNIATATFLGKEYFEEFVLEYEKRHIVAIKEAGAYILYHNCGDANALYPTYNRLGPDIFESFVEPPYGDTDLDYALQTLDKNIVMIGNIDQIDFLMHATPNEVQSRCKCLMDYMKERGRFVLGTTDYLSEGTPIENLVAMKECV
ncbi:MAG TPA: hypothetical protein DDZ89_02730, partial [Clostridiales bacterium]|nr:hypothetical protein [Clostridiales bacterium]